MADKPTISPFMDLKALSRYSCLGVPTLRDYIRSGGLPHYKLPGKILVRQGEFDKGVEGFRVDSQEKLDSMVDDIMKGLKHG